MKTITTAKNALKHSQNPSSLIKLRHRRDTFPNEQQREGTDYYDDNYDVLPDSFAGSQPATVGDVISEQAKRVAESFKKMWESMVDSVRHCIDALRVMFGEPLGDEDLTPEQEQEILADFEAKYRLKQEHNNVYENQI